MKTLFIITIILQFSLSAAQDNTEDPTDKPSWSEDLPEMIDAPEINLDSTIDTNIDFGTEELRIDRSAMFNDSEDVAKENSGLGLDDQADSDEDITGDDNQADQGQAEAEKAAAEKAVADKVAAEKVAAEKAVADKILADKIAAEQVVASEIAVENVAAAIDDQEQVADEKAAAEKIAQDKAAAEQAAADQFAKELAEAVQSTNEQAEVVTVYPQSNQKIAPYQWVQTKNVAPKYPSRAARTGETGWVNVELEINVYGDVVSTNIMASYRNSKTFQRAATDAVKEWKFDPPMNYGIEENQFKIYKISFKF